jgi:hypothetical protein
LKKVSDFIERSNYYSAKGITQVELVTYMFRNNGTEFYEYYLKIRCNLSVIMNESRVFILDDGKYSTQEIMDGIRKRLYEINEFRYIRLHQMPLNVFRTNRADFAQDITVERPEIITWLCNMSFPYQYRRMKRKPVHKPVERLYFESCCFSSRSREFNLYTKHTAMANTRKTADPSEEDKARHTFRCEIQVKKRGISYLASKLPEKKNPKQFLESDFCNDYLRKEILHVFQDQDYVSRSRAFDIIDKSTFSPCQKKIMKSILDMIQRCNGLYELEKAIADDSVHTPPQYGTLRSFRNRWLKRIRSLGIQPVVIPDEFGIDTVPSIYRLLSDNIF